MICPLMSEKRLCFNVEGKPYNLTPCIKEECAWWVDRQVTNNLGKVTRNLIGCAVKIYAGGVRD